MKHLFLLGLSCALASSAFAQTEKGARYIGANVGNLSYGRSDKNNSISATLTPSAGVFVGNNFLLGAGLPISYSRSHFETTFQKSTRREVAVGLVPFARYYLPGTGAHRFFGHLQAGIARGSYRYQAEGMYFASGGQAVITKEDQRSSQTSLTLGAGLGYNYFLTPGAALEVVASYGRYGIGDYDSAGALNVSAGFAVFLPSKGAAAK
ncbi:outer membrane beta-barrel protein [Hymenobacter yonginensis]|uniref:Outer membrane beta-barrel protein n=1 Tax=Hymenobacter yonginensis TaxID=748197 RepID=A0ABY7PNX1_9BACT|nr:outer membrane beta-barrel protein [Hymenobacter yonginensis]WBO84354.1 outer membrane beta-barrel protein [Hymenobacter yonginensis]